MEPTATPTTYTVSCLPEDGLGSDMYDIQVQYVGAFRWGIPTPETRHWAVRLRGHWCLSNTGKWDQESIPSEREDEWLDNHRFTLADALERAKKAAPDVMVQGETAAQFHARRNRA